MKLSVLMVVVGAGVACASVGIANAESPHDCVASVEIGNEGAAPRFSLTENAAFVLGSKRYRVVSGLAHLDLDGARIERAIVALCDAQGRTHWRAGLIEADRTLELHHVALGDPRGGDAFARFRIVLNPADAVWEAAGDQPETLKIVR